MLAPPSPLRLIPPSGHTNAVLLFPGGRRLCLRRPPRCALFLRRATPTRFHFSRADTAFVGVPIPATPYSSIGPRQHDRKFPGRTPPLLASPSPLRLIPPSDHANTTGNFPGGRRLCLRPPPRYALFLHRATPTRSYFSRADVAFVCVPLPAKPCFFVGSRQRGPTFPGQTPPLLASPYPLRLVSPSGHANAVPLFPGRRRLCWRPPTRYALFLHRATPTRPEISRPDAAFVGSALPAAPYFFALPRQRGPTFPGRTPPLLASPSPLRLISSPCHANAVPLFPGGRRLYWRPPPRCALFLRLATPTRSHFSRPDAAFVGAALPAAPYSFASPRQHRPEIS